MNHNVPIIATLQIFVLLIYFLLPISAYNRKPKSPMMSHIIGGFEAIGSYPYMVSLLLDTPEGLTHNCGGSIINERTVITAAHCLYNYDMSSIHVHVGEKTRKVIEGKVYDIEAMYWPDEYTFFNYDYDMALVRIKGFFKFDDNIQPIELVKPDDIIDVGSYATVLGWGVTNLESNELAEYLMMAHVPIVEQNICNRYMGGQITERMLCAGYSEGGVDACLLDSGGPLVLNNKLIGIVSWGYSCALPKKPGVYVRVSKFLSWIDRMLFKNYCEVLYE